MKFKIKNYPIKLRNTEVIAGYIGVPAGQLFKSLVAIDGSNPILVMIPSNTRLNLERLKAILGLNELVLAPSKLAEKLTGMKVGGISPLRLLNKNIPIYISEIAMQHDWISFSYGQRGTVIQMPAVDMLTITKAKILNI